MRQLQAVDRKLLAAAPALGPLLLGDGDHARAVRDGCLSGIRGVVELANLYRMWYSEAK